jgi:ribosomal protein S18 acetylase RimI-like enzyme
MQLRPFHIAPVRSAADLAATIELFRSYVRSLPIDLSYQNFDLELAAMPGQYAPPAGELLLARDVEGRSRGCVGLRGIEPIGCCEMKRLYVDPSARGAGLGSALVATVIQVAAARGYSEIRLDTLPSMTRALALYEEHGFRQIPAYYDTPVVGTVFMSRSL